MSNYVPRVIATQEATALIKQLQNEHGEILFHQSGGCCDGSVPLCYEVQDFKVGENDLKLGVLAGAGFYMHKAQYEYYKHAQIIIEAQDGNGSEFSIEYGSGKKFTFNLRLLTKEELDNLNPLE